MATVRMASPGRCCPIRRGPGRQRYPLSRRIPQPMVVHPRGEAEALAEMCPSPTRSVNSANTGNRPTAGFRIIGTQERHRGGDRCRRFHRRRDRQEICRRRLHRLRRVAATATSSRRWSRTSRRRRPDRRPARSTHARKTTSPPSCRRPIRQAPLEVCIFNVGANVNFPLLDTTERVFRKVWEMAC